MKINYTITDIRNIEIWPLIEVKNYLRISHDYDDRLLLNLLNSATESAEMFLGINLNIKSLRVKINKGSDVIRLKYVPILDIETVSLEDANGKSNIMDDFGDIQTDGLTISLNSKYIARDLEIEYQAGYRGDSIPKAIQHGILMHVSEMYENSIDAVSLSSQIKDLYTPYRIMKI